MRSAIESRSRADTARACDAIVAAALPHVRVAGREAPLTLDDCAFYGFSGGIRGAYFPHLHWDTDWMQFPQCDGFQCWFFMENDDPLGHGNMFMGKSAQLEPSDPPCEFFFEPGGAVSKNVLHPSKADPSKKDVLASYVSVDECGFSFEYLHCQPGDLLVFSKRTLHMSDPRPVLRSMQTNRLAINLRVLILPPGAKGTSYPERPLRYWGGHWYKSAFPMIKRIHARAVAANGPDTDPDGELMLALPDRWDMLSIMDSLVA